MVKLRLKTLYTLVISASIVVSLLFVTQSKVLVLGNPIGPNIPINHIYIRSNGTIEPANAPIAVNGDTYALTGNITNATLTIERDNVVLDGAGYSITGNSTQYYDGITVLDRTNVTIKNIKIFQFAGGIQLLQTSNSTISANVMATLQAISMFSSDYNIIIGNVATSGSGVSGHSSNNNLIKDNSFSCNLSAPVNYNGVFITGSNNTITNNTLTHDKAIRVFDSNNNIISNNTIIDGQTGIELTRASNNMIFGNTLKGKTDNATGALYITQDSFNNTVFENTFQSNTLAVYLRVYNNTFYKNNFINNTNGVLIMPGIQVNWDNGAVGNYWSNFQGTDSNSDGISETPYVINANNTDHYPLMGQFGNSTLLSASSSPTASQTAAVTELPTPLWALVIIVITTLISGLVYKSKRVSNK